MKTSKGKEYDVHSYTNRVHAPGRFRQTVTRHLSELSLPGTALSSAGSGVDVQERRRSEQLAMFRITAETCRAFTLAEVLLLAAMKLETSGEAPPAASVDGIKNK
jgi:hypothetical protein